MSVSADPSAWEPGDLVIQGNRIEQLEYRHSAGWWDLVGVWFIYETDAHLWRHVPKADVLAAFPGEEDTA